MTWINLYGLVFMAVIMAPNILFAIKERKGFENKYHNRMLEILEQVGRFGCFGLMIVNIPGLCAGFWFPGAKGLYLVANGAFILAYCAVWLACWNRNSVFRSLALSVLPSLVFLFSGVMLGYIPLFVLAAIFAAGHIPLSYKNAVL